MSWAALVVCLLLVVMFAYCVVRTLFDNQSLSRSQLLICESGVCWFDGRAADVVPWSEVAGVAEVWSREMVDLWGPFSVPGAKRRSYHVYLSRGTVWSFDGTLLDQINLLGVTLERIAVERGIPWHSEHRV